MNVRSIMSPDVFSCRTDDSLESAARLLWEQDCGSLPVVDALGHVRAVITDRDICMAAYITGRSLAELRVAESMSPRLVTCSPEDSLAGAAQAMCEHAVRRLPVVDAEGKLCGVLSVNDLVRADGADRQALTVLSAVSMPRFARRKGEEQESTRKTRAGKAAVKVLQPTAGTKAKRKTSKKAGKAPRGKS